MDSLLKLLSKNARLPNADLARMAGLTEEETERRIKAYEDDGVIRAYVAVLNEERVGEPSVRAMIEVKLSPERGGGFDRLAARIAGHDEVISCYLMSAGSYDLQIVVEGENLQAVAAFVSEKLATIQGVLSTSTHFLFKTYKEQGVTLSKEPPGEKLPISP